MSQSAKQIFLIILVTLVNFSQQEGCPIDIIASYPWDPLVTSPNSHELLYPPISNLDGNYTITIPVGHTIIISCPKGHFLDGTGLNSVARTIYATCNRDFQFESHEDRIINFANISCVSHDPISVNITKESCAEDAVIIEIGHQIGVNINLATQIRVCFDIVKKIPLFSQNNLTKSIGFIKSYLVTLYLEDNLYHYDTTFDEIYNLTNQQRVINRLLGADDDSVDFVDPFSCNRGPGWATTPGFCFGLSPLVYRGTFVYLIQQYSTYRYINTLPAWTFVYEYNWYKLEQSIINFAKSMKIDLEVYTGSWGVTTLQHTKSEIDVDLYLYTNEQTGEKSLPIPAILWKLIYDPLTNLGTVFVTVNNPHRVKPEDLICSDISDSIAWVTWEKTNVTKGFSYACSYSDAKETIQYLPDLYVVDVLI